VGRANELRSIVESLKGYVRLEGRAIITPKLERSSPLISAPILMAHKDDGF
jgi:hypothetical protein